MYVFHGSQESPDDDSWEKLGKALVDPKRAWQVPGVVDISKGCQVRKLVRIRSFGQIAYGDDQLRHPQRIESQVLHQTHVGRPKVHLEVGGEFVHETVEVSLVALSLSGSWLLCRPV